MAPSALAIIGVTIILSSFLSGVFGMAGGMVLLGVLLNYFDVATGMILFSIIQFFVNSMRVVQWRHYVRWGIFGWYMVGAAISFTIMWSIAIVPDKAFVYLALGLVPFMGIAGQIALGHFSDRFGREAGWTLAAGGFALCYLLLLALAAFPNAGLLYAMVIAQGLLGYGLASVFAAVPAEIFQGKRYATIFGVLNTSAVGGGGVAPWVTGVIYDRTGSYALAWWLSIACCMVSIVCIWVAAPRKVRAVAGQIRHLSQTS